MSVRERRALFALLTLAVVAGPVLAVGSPLPTAVGHASADQTTMTTPTSQDLTTITIQLDQNGDAHWTIRTHVDVESDEERESFRELARRHENGERATPWLDEVRAAADATAEATGRSMNLTDVRRSSSVDNTTLSVQFTWTDFAREEGDHFVVDDAFNTTSGTWMDGLTEDQVLVIELPRGYGVLSAPTHVSYDRHASLRWQGPVQFEPGYMEIVYSGEATPDTTTPGQENDNLLWGGFFVLGLGIVAVGAYVFSQRRGGLPSPAAGSDDGPDTPPGATSTADASGDAARQTATAGTVEPDPADPTSDVDEELLSDEERVEHLLESNGGRMKQANIVKETGWSNAKVSQLLSAMAEEGDIDKLRIGRENLISFPDEDVTDVDRD